MVETLPASGPDDKVGDDVFYENPRLANGPGAS